MPLNLKYLPRSGTRHVRGRCRIAAAITNLTAIWDRLGEDDRDILLTLGQALAGGVFKPRGVLALIPFTTVQLRDAFLRLHQQPDTVNITLTFPRGGGSQAVKGIDATGRAREEDEQRATRGAAQR